jgi:hypothetical protein
VSSETPNGAMAGALYSDRCSCKLLSFICGVIDTALTSSSGVWMATRARKLLSRPRPAWPSLLCLLASATPPILALPTAVRTVLVLGFGVAWYS